VHHRQASSWLKEIPADGNLILSRFAQLGILRLLTNPSVMGQETLAIGQAWNVLDRLGNDPRVKLQPEPAGLERTFRQATSHLGDRPASKWVGDCFLLAYAHSAQATLVTFDKALLAFSCKHGYAAISPE
jgi:hypothetical protein